MQKMSLGEAVLGVVIRMAINKHFVINMIMSITVVHGDLLITF